MAIPNTRSHMKGNAMAYVLKRYLLVEGASLPDEMWYQSLASLVRNAAHVQEVWDEGEPRGLAVWIIVDEDD